MSTSILFHLKCLTLPHHQIKNQLLGAPLVRLGDGNQKYTDHIRKRHVHVHVRTRNVPSIISCILYIHIEK